VAAIGIACSPPGPAQAADLAYGSASRLCAVTDPRISESSGLAVDRSRLFTVNDGGTSLEVYVLDRSCRVTAVLRAGLDPYDVEDLARAADGTLWLADIGDNTRSRKTVALEALREDGQAVLFRFSYPDGPHDAEALLLDRSGRPFLVTKEPSGRAGVYTPDGAPSAERTTALRRVAEVALSPTGTPGGPVGTLGQVLVTGGAVSDDGTQLALRTYTDAYVYAVPDGDVVAALAGRPVRVPLPAAPQGEAIVFDGAGADLLVTTEGSPFPVTAIPALGAPASSSGSSSASSSGSQPGSQAGSQPGSQAGSQPASTSVSSPSQSPSPGTSDSGGNSRLTDVLIAAGVAALLVLGFGLLRRRPQG